MKSIDLEKLFDRLFPITRSISGRGLRDSLEIIGEYIPLNIIEYKSGTRCFDWTVPDEWNISDAYIKDSKGNRIVDYPKNNLHVMGYSSPVSKKISLKELKKHIHTLPDKPDAIPFVTSYYKRDWGFCLTQSVLSEMHDDEYEILIDSSLMPGAISLGELLIKGKSKKEILLYSHIGHPSMANDQLSGPLTLVAVANWLIAIKDNLKYSYRIVLAPETIGSISYIAKNNHSLKKRVIGGLTVVCTADKGGFTYRTSKDAKTQMDSAMEIALNHSGEKFRVSDFSPMGCDERHFNSHGIGIPIGSIMRTPPGEYPEYHTSLDNKDFISFSHLEASIDLIKAALLNLESDCRILALHKNCEPKLDKYGLYPTTSNRNSDFSDIEILLTIWAFADGRLLSDLCSRLGLSTSEIRRYADKLAEYKIIKIKELA